MNQPKSIAQSWFEYQAATLPPDAAATQRKLMRRAFYAGYAAATPMLSWAILQGEAPPTQEVAEVYDSAGAELQRFSAAVAAGEA